MELSEEYFSNDEEEKQPTLLETKSSPKIFTFSSSLLTLYIINISSIC